MQFAFKVLTNCNKNSINRAYFCCKSINSEGIRHYDCEYLTKFMQGANPEDVGQHTSYFYEGYIDGKNKFSDFNKIRNCKIRLSKQISDDSSNLYSFFIPEIGFIASCYKCFDTSSINNLIENVDKIVEEESMNNYFKQFILAFKSSNGIRWIINHNVQNKRTTIIKQITE